MNSDLLYGAAIGNVILLMCCLVGVLMTAIHGRGRARWFAVSGFALIVLSRLVSMGVAALSLAGTGIGMQSAGIIDLLPAVFTLLGLISLGLSLIQAPREFRTREEQP